MQIAPAERERNWVQWGGKQYLRLGRIVKWSKTQQRRQLAPVQRSSEREAHGCILKLRCICFAQSKTKSSKYYVLAVPSVKSAVQASLLSLFPSPPCILQAPIWSLSPFAPSPWICCKHRQGLHSAPSVLFEPFAPSCLCHSPNTLPPPWLKWQAYPSQLYISIVGGILAFPALNMNSSSLGRHGRKRWTSLLLQSWDSWWENYGFQVPQRWTEATLAWTSLELAGELSKARG